MENIEHVKIADNVTNGPSYKFSHPQVTPDNAVVVTVDVSDVVPDVVTDEVGVDVCDDVAVVVGEDVTDDVAVVLVVAVVVGDVVCAVDKHSGIIPVLHIRIVRMPSPSPCVLVVNHITHSDFPRLRSCCRSFGVPKRYPFKAYSVEKMPTISTEIHTLLSLGRGVAGFRFLQATFG